MSEKYIPKYLTEDIEHYLNIPSVKKFHTNSKIAFYLQDIESYVHNMEKPDSKSSNPQPYKMGSLKGVDIYVDPYMRWDDDRIIFFDENDNQINDVLFKMTLYEEKSSNEERANRLKIILDDDVEETNKFNDEQKRLEQFRRIMNLDKVFRELVFNLLKEYPEIQKIKTSPSICSKLNLYEVHQDKNEISTTLSRTIPENTITISFKIGFFKGKQIAEYDKRIFDEKLILYLDNQQITDDIIFLDENDNEVYKTNMNSI